MPALKSSAVAAVASDLGCSDGHTPAPGEIAGGADLLGAFEAELLPFDGHAVHPPAKRGPGRPAGSVNRTTRQLQSFLLQKGYRDPAEFLAATMSQDTRELATRLGCEPVEALKVQRAAAVDLMPYFHQRQTPIEPERAGIVRPVVMIFDHAGPVATRAGDLAMSVNDPQQYQGHSDVDAVASHDSVSHDDV